MDKAEICIIFLCSTAFVSGMIFLINTITNRKRQKYIESIKPGDIFCFYSDVDSYYRKYEKYKHELTNPFDLTPIPIVFPGGTCIIKELKESDTGEIWICYNLIGNVKELKIAENSDRLVKHYGTLEEFLALRERVKRVEI